MKKRRRGNYKKKLKRETLAPNLNLGILKSMTLLNGFAKV
jgi:hypothetical protein